MGISWTIPSSKNESTAISAKSVPKSAIAGAKESSVCLMIMPGQNLSYAAGKIFASAASGTLIQKYHSLTEDAISLKRVYGLTVLEDCLIKSISRQKLSLVVARPFPLAVKTLGPTFTNELYNYVGATRASARRIQTVCRKKCRFPPENQGTR